MADPKHPADLKHWTELATKERKGQGPEGVLRTIENNFGLRPLADGDCKALPITGIWTQGADAP